MHEPGVDCHYQIEGTGPDVTLIHGVGASLRTWDQVVPTLVQSYRCLRYDLRGHGRSPMPDQSITLQHLVDDVERLRRAVGIDSAHIIGHSLGGMIGPAYALQYPERVLSLGLLSTAAGRTEEEKANVTGLVDALKEKSVAAMLDGLVERWFTPEFARANPEIVAARRQQVLATDEDVFLNVFRIYAETELAPRLPGIKVPALVMTGEDDGGCNPRINRFIADAVPNAELVILERLRHAILLEDPKRVATELLRFLHNTKIV